MNYSALTPESQTHLAGQIARALAVFCVDEVVVFDDGQVKLPRHGEDALRKDIYTGFSDPNYFLAHVLAYIETPPHLRKHLFPMQPDLRLAGALPSLDMPHHLRRTDWCQYREGVSISQGEDSKPSLPSKENTKSKVKDYTQVETGLVNQVYVPGVVPGNTRVTVKFKEAHGPQGDAPKDIIASAVAPSAPREEAGYYWGYTVRSAPSLSAVLTECRFDGGYDLTFGTSERGIPLSDLTGPQSPDLPKYRHMLIIFGGVAGLEVAVKADEELDRLGVRTPDALFDYWVNLVLGQGSRTIRTEEAVWLGLMGLRDTVQNNGHMP